MYPRSSPISLTGKFYGPTTCFDGKTPFEKRRYPDEDLILSIVKNYCVENKINNTVFVCGRPLKSEQPSCRDQIVFDAETMQWNDKGELTRSFDVSERMNYFKNLPVEQRPKKYILVFHWNYHHGFFIADFENNSYMFLDPLKSLQKRDPGSHYQKMQQLFAALQKEYGQEKVFEYPTTLQFDGNSCGPITAECLCQLMKAYCENPAFTLEKKDFFKIPVPNAGLATMKFRLYCLNNVHPNDELVNEVSLVNTELLQAVFDEQKTPGETRHNIWEQLEEEKFFAASLNPDELTKKKQLQAAMFVRICPHVENDFHNLVKDQKNLQLKKAIGEIKKELNSYLLYLNLQSANVSKQTKVQLDKKIEAVKSLKTTLEDETKHPNIEHRLRIFHQKLTEKNGAGQVGLLAHRSTSAVHAFFRDKYWKRMVTNCLAILTCVPGLCLAIHSRFFTPKKSFNFMVFEGEVVMEKIAAKTRNL